MSNLFAVKLGDCISKVIDCRGKTPTKLGGAWAENGIRVISALNVHSGVIDNIDQIRFVDETLYKKWMQDEIKRDDLLLSSEGASLGENAIWDSDEKIVLGQRLFAIRTDINKLDPWYFAGYMQTDKFRQQVDQISTGSTVFGISQPLLKEIQLIIPDIEIQRRIGKIYQTIRSKITVNNKVKEELEYFTKIIQNLWFLQFEFPNDVGKPYKSSGGKMKWDEELNREIPEDWECVSLVELFSFTKGKIPAKLYDKNDGTLSPYLTIDVVNNGIPQYCKQTSMPFCDKKTIMVMDGAASGDVYTGYTGVLGSTFAMLTPKRKDVSNELLFWILKTLSVMYKKNNTGSTVPHANKSYIEAMKIALPKNCEKLGEKFVIIQDKINIINEENKELLFLRDYLLPLLLNGQVTFKT